MKKKTVYVALTVLLGLTCCLTSVRAYDYNDIEEFLPYNRTLDGDPYRVYPREWLPAFRLSLDEATGRFYHYAFANLDGFDGAGKFPGGHTRTTLEKLLATKVPRFVPVDLAPLSALEAELGEVLRKIRPRGLMADEHETLGISAAASGDLERSFRPVAVEVLGDLER